MTMTNERNCICPHCRTGIAFWIKSGGGKSPMFSSGSRFLSDNVKIINGDKPLIRLIGKKYMPMGRLER